MLKLDLHVHTSHSIDGMFSVREMVESARRKGLSGIAIADHNTTSGLREAMELSSRDFLVIPGAEVSSGGAHVVALGIEEDIERGLPLSKTVETIRRRGGVAILAHPFVPGRNPNAVREAKFDAIEVLNSRAFFLSNPLARRYAEGNGMTAVAGSDAHHADDVGTAYTCVDCRPDVDDVLREIREGRTKIGGRALSFPTLLWRFVQRTFSRR
ncbi:MAG: PHP domain-containing protein [Candidatus Hadarchaeales archaeon]